MRPTRLLVLPVAAGLVLTSVAHSQNPPPRMGSVGHIASRFIPIETLNRMRDRPQGVLDSVTVPSSLDSTWSALKMTLGKLEVPIGFEERSAWQIGNAQAKVYRRMGSKPMSTYLRCGDGVTGPNADNYVVYFSFLSALRQQPDSQVSLFTLIAGRAVDLAGGRNDPVDCTTTGRLEQEIGKQVTKLLGAASK